MVVCCRFREMASRDPFEALRYLQVKHHLLYSSSLLVFCECLVDRFTHSLLHEESNSQRGPPPPSLPASLPPSLPGQPTFHDDTTALPAK